MCQYVPGAGGRPSGFLGGCPVHTVAPITGYLKGTDRTVLLGDD